MATIAMPSRPDRVGRELTDFSVSNADKSGPYADNLEVDALLIGAGFAGVFMLKTLRERGYKTVIFEAGNDIGGNWRWNCYPGAAVDSEMPIYEFSWPEVWKTWTWTTNYPEYREIRAYFEHVDKVVGVKQDCAFHTVVVGAKFDTGSGKWSVRTKDGRTTTAKYLIPCLGIAASRHFPQWPGMDKFKGEIHHSSFWPEGEVDVKDKRCAIIGTGASGVQLVQAWGPVAGQLRVFQRTPNLALPMRRRKMTVEEQERKRDAYSYLFRLRETTFGGMLYDFDEKNTFDVTPEQRRAFYEDAWEKGGFRFWLAVYKDSLYNAEANKGQYDFWVEKTRARIEDARTRDLVAPLQAPHAFGVKRPSLESTYFEEFNRPNVDVVDVRSNPIKEFTETGITLEDGTHHEFDVIALATGFDIFMGATTRLGLESINNTKLEEDWKEGMKTYLGLGVTGYPNMFSLYGPHGPTLLCNGPTAIEVQGRWVADLLDKMERQGIKYINPEHEATQEWTKLVHHLTNISLLPTMATSTYMGGNEAGRKSEATCFAGGLPMYKAEIRAAFDTLKGFEVVKA